MSERISLILEGAQKPSVGGVFRHIESLVKSLKYKNFEFILLSTKDQSDSELQFLKQFNVTERHVSLFHPHAIKRYWPFKDKKLKQVYSFIESLIAGDTQQKLQKKFLQLKKMKFSNSRAKKISQCDIKEITHICETHFQQSEVNDVRALVRSFILPLRNTIMNHTELNVSHVFSVGLPLFFALKNSRDTKKIIVDVHGDFLAELEFQFPHYKSVQQAFKNLVNFNSHQIENMVYRGVRSQLQASQTETNIVRINNFSANKFKSPKGSDTLRISYVGRLSREKDVLTVIEQFKDFNQQYTERAELNIIAPKGYEKKYYDLLKVKIKKYRLTNVNFHFDLNQKDLYAFTDVLLLMSDYETQPLVLIEAAQLEIPVICNDLPSLRQMVTSRKYQKDLFINKKEKNEAVEALNLMSNITKRKQYGQLLKSILDQKHTEKAFRSSYDNLYRDVSII